MESNYIIELCSREYMERNESGDILEMQGSDCLKRSRWLKRRISQLATLRQEISSSWRCRPLAGWTGRLSRSHPSPLPDQRRSYTAVQAVQCIGTSRVPKPQATPKKNCLHASNVT